MPKDIYKTCLIGDAFVGKTTLLKRLRKPNIKIKEKSEASTIGAIFTVLDLKDKKDNTIYTTNIWDTAGQERFRSLISLYYKRSNLVLIVFDLSDFDSFKSVFNWYNEVINNYGKYNVIIIGNKSDKINNKIDFREKLENKGIYEPYIEISAIKNTNIEILKQMMIKKFKKIKLEKIKNIILSDDYNNEVSDNFIKRKIRDCCFV